MFHENGGVFDYRKVFGSTLQGLRKVSIGILHTICKVCIL